MLLVSLNCAPSTYPLAHVRCMGERGPDQPCYCACHYPEPSYLMDWQCSHRAGRGDENERKAHPVTERMRRANTNFARNNTIKFRRPD